jgi:serine/threonine protein kinase
VQLTDFGLSRVGLINSTDDLSGPAATSTMLMEESMKNQCLSPKHVHHQRKIRQQRSAVGTPDYLAPEILLGTSHGKSFLLCVEPYQPKFTFYFLDRLQNCVLSNPLRRICFNCLTVVAVLSDLIFSC